MDLFTIGSGSETKNGCEGDYDDRASLTIDSQKTRTRSLVVKYYTTCVANLLTSVA